jgi:hypothetical protein
MIKIEEIKIANFRSYKEKGNGISKLSKINVMVGKNNVGKTNLLRAIYLFFNPASFNPSVDVNYIKQITGGASKLPKIDITFIDDEILHSKSDGFKKYTISCNLNKLNKKEGIYSLITQNEEIESKLKTNSDIKKYLEKKIKCVFLSTTDDNIESQSQDLINDLIFKYYQKKNRIIKNSVKKFEESYKQLKDAFSENISSIEGELSEQFKSMEGFNIVPKFEFDLNKEITKFLMENIELRLDDDYAQEFGTKGAGVQRSSLILITIYLLKEIYTKENKIILLDEPEAFLYPLLEKQIKVQLEQTISNENKDENTKIQIFMTSHSSTYLNEISNPDYSFSYLKQISVKKEYKRSKNNEDTNKYTIIEPMNRKNRYEVLKNYGLLDSVNDYPYVIVCEGETDRNYIVKLLEEQDDIPQIRYGKYSDGLAGKASDLNYKYIGRGTSSILPILIYLDNVSSVSRKVFVLLDGDKEGQNVNNSINSEEYSNLELKKYILPKNKVIEDVVFTKEQYANRVVSKIQTLNSERERFTQIISDIDSKKSVIEQTKQFVEGNNIPEADIKYIKSMISQDLNSEILQKGDLYQSLIDFFYQ